MRSISYMMVTLVLSIFLTVVSDFVGEDRRTEAIQNAIEQIGRTYAELQISAPEKATELDRVLKEEAGYGVNEILKYPDKLDAKGVKALGAIGIHVKYVHSVYSEPLGYLMDNILRFVLFFVLAGGLSFLVNSMSELRRVVLDKTDNQCPIPDASIRHQITVTLAEVLSSEPELAKKLTSPNESLVNSEVLQGIRNFCNGNARAGLILVRTNCDYREYADVALMLDKGAKRSINSTNVGTPEELFRVHRTEVSEHLEEVNVKVRSPRERMGVIVRRRQIHLTQEDKDQYDSFLAIASQEVTDYKALYSDVTNVDFKELMVGPQLGWPEFLGDYLVYDDRIILKFDKDTRVLMLLVGQEVIAQHVAVFSK